MRKILPLLAAMSATLAACGYSYGTTGYDRYAYGYNPYAYNPIIGSIGALGSGYGSSFSQAAANACAGYASRYGPVRINSVRQTDYDRMKVYGYVSRGYGSDNWDCTFRADGRISDFDI